MSTLSAPDPVQQELKQVLEAYVAELPDWEIADFQYGWVFKAQLAYLPFQVGKGEGEVRALVHQARGKKRFEIYSDAPRRLMADTAVSWPKITISAERDPAEAAADFQRRFVEPYGEARSKAEEQLQVLIEQEEKQAAIQRRVCGFLGEETFGAGEELSHISPEEDVGRMRIRVGLGGANRVELRGLSEKRLMKVLKAATLPDSTDQPPD